MAYDTRRPQIAERCDKENSGIFVQMKKLDVIDGAFCERLIKIAKFRNRLVHLYWEIERQMVYRIIQDNLDDFKLFQEKVVVFLK